MNQLLWIIICCISLRSSLRSSPINGQSAIRIWAVLSINISREDVNYLHILFIELETSIDWPFTANYERCVICPEAVTSIATRAIVCDIAWYVIGISSFGGLFNSTFGSVDFHFSRTESPFGYPVSQDSQHSSAAEAAYRYTYGSATNSCGVAYDVPWHCLGGLESRQAYNTDLTMWLSNGGLSCCMWSSCAVFETKPHHHNDCQQLIIAITRSSVQYHPS